MRFAELLGRSCFSFLEGASHPHEMVAQSLARGQHAIAICDRDGLYGSVRAHVAAREAGQRIIVGAELTLSQGERSYIERPYPAVALLCETHEGYGSLCRLLTRAHADHEKGEAGISAEAIAGDSAGLFAVVPYDPRCPVGGEDLDRLRDAFSSGGEKRCALATWRHLDRHDALRLERVREASARHDIPIVASNRPT